MTSHASRHDVPSTAVDSDAAEATPAEHRFSESYQRRRQALIDQYGGATQADRQASGATGAAASSRLKWKIGAIAAAAALVVVPVSAWAVANNADFFAAAFGSDARTSVQTHEEVQGYKDGKPVVVTYPNREYVETDLEAAERLLGPYIAADEAKVQFGGHTLTVQSAVRDSDAMVVGYTLERPGGVTALKWDELTNQAKGALQPNDEPYLWEFVAGTAEKRKGAATATAGPDSLDGEGRDDASADDTDAFRNWGSGCTLVDPGRSTADKLYCYDYLVFSEPPAKDVAVTLQVIKRSEDESGNGISEVEQRVELPVKDALPSRTFSAEGVGTVSVSPISVLFAHSGDGGIVDEETARARYDKYFGEGFGSFEDFLEDCNSEDIIDACRKMIVKYRDGSEYTVFNDITDLDNTAYTLGREHELGTVWMFNRLVDPQNIESITVNDVTFS